MALSRIRSVRLAEWHRLVGAVANMDELSGLAFAPSHTLVLEGPRRHLRQHKVRLQ